MSCKKVYRCDICRDEKQFSDLTGLRFKSNKEFVLDGAGTTDGTHICNTCALQLHKQLVAMFGEVKKP